MIYKKEIQFLFSLFFKIIKSYTLDDCENPIKPIFIEKLTQKLNERQTHVSHFFRIIDFKYLRLFVKFPFISLTDTK